MRGRAAANSVLRATEQQCHGGGGRGGPTFQATVARDISGAPIDCGAGPIVWPSEVKGMGGEGTRSGEVGRSPAMTATCHPVRTRQTLEGCLLGHHKLWPDAPQAVMHFPARGCTTTQVSV